MVMICVELFAIAPKNTAALLNRHQVVYLHIAEVNWDAAPDTPLAFKQVIGSGLADRIGFGRPFVANPDLPVQLAQGYPMTAHDPDTLFGGGERGLTAYPVYLNAT